VVHLDLRTGDEKAVNYVLWGILGGLVGVALYEASKIFLGRYIHWRRDEIFLRFVRVTFPHAKTVEVISVSGTDKQAIENVERRLRNASRNL
jgi:hypothetical protein